MSDDWVRRWRTRMGMSSRGDLWIEDESGGAQGPTLNRTKSPPVRLGAFVSSWLGPSHVAVAYLALIAAAELATLLVDPRVGPVAHAGLLLALLLHASRLVGQPGLPLLLALTLAPLIRLLGLSLPLATFPLLYWVGLTGAPLLLAVTLVIHAAGYSWREIGLRAGWLPVQLLVGLSGVALGYVEYAILRPDPPVAAFTVEQLWLPALILLVGTGFTEELVFRGVLQRAAGEVLGRSGILYVSILFAVLHVGYRSVADVLFVFGVAMYLGYVAARTRSLLGVSLAHGLANIVLFLVAPFFPLALPEVSALMSTAVPIQEAVGAPAATAGLELVPTALPAPTPDPSPTAMVAGAPPSPVPTAPPEPSPTATPGPRVEVLAERLNVRSGPGPGHPAITIVRKGDRLDLTGRNEAGDWWRVRLPSGEAGWVWASAVSDPPDPDRVPVVEE